MWTEQDKKVSEQLMWLSPLWWDGKWRYCRLQTVNHTSSLHFTFKTSSSFNILQADTARLCVVTIYRGTAEWLAPLSGPFHFLSKAPTEHIFKYKLLYLPARHWLDVSHLILLPPPKGAWVRRYGLYRMTLTALHRDHKLQMHEELSDGPVKCEPIKH